MTMDEPICSAIGCTAPAAVIIELSDARHRPVCHDHADDGAVIDNV